MLYFFKYFLKFKFNSLIIFADFWIALMPLWGSPACEVLPETFISNQKTPLSSITKLLLVGAPKIRVWGFITFSFFKYFVPSGPRFSSSVTNVKSIFSLIFGKSLLKFLAKYKWTAALPLQLTAPSPYE